MRGNSLFKRYEVLIAGACLSAHVIAKGKGFRPSDMRFYLELFSNWLEFSFGGGVVSVENTQVGRYLNKLISEGYARRQSCKGKVSYVLTRTGLLEMVSHVILPEEIQSFEMFCFQVYFAGSYGRIAKNEIARQGKQFPLALRIEVDELLDIDRLFERRRLFLEKELRKLEARARESLDSARLAQESFAEGKNVGQVLDEVKYRHPYHLSSQKSLAELILELPEEIQAWELGDGSRGRANFIWQPVVRAFKDELVNLSNMRATL